MQAGSDTMTNKITDNTVAKALGIVADRIGNIMQMISGFCKLNPLKKALGIAALNALSAILFERGDYDIQAADTFDEIEPTDYGKVTVVGALVPIIKKLIAADSDFSILELDPKTLKEREMKYFVPADRTDTVVPYSDLLVITGVTILNDTLPGLLEMAKPGAEIAVTGPTA